MSNKAPWSDFKGLDLFEGDEIRHPDGSSGVVIFLAMFIEDYDAWRVVYAGDEMLRLCLQIGDKGMAVKV